MTLDDDVADALREGARRLGVPFKQIVNDTLRRGLSPARRRARLVYQVQAHQSGFRAGIDPLRLNQLNDALEAGAIVTQDSE
ncbi:antitoxin [Candidatus Poriferisodalis sp.]|uniref:antitoxin n=1 Tax=Candidatus Poriferisodalis sp. TaxID=3101277 RepID=UPI003C6FCA59